MTVTLSAAADADTSNGVATFDLSATGMTTQTVTVTVTATESDDDALVELIIDNLDAAFSTTGTWGESGAFDEHSGSSRYATVPGATATWLGTGLPTAGNYEVFVWYSGLSSSGSHFNRDSAAIYDVHHDGTVDTVIIDQDNNQGTWVSLGTYTFSGVVGESVVLTASNLASSTSGTIADAVRWVRQD